MWLCSWLKHLYYFKQETPAKVASKAAPRKVTAVSSNGKNDTSDSDSDDESDDSDSDEVWIISLL